MSDKNLLQKCLHGKTKKDNESLNGLIWQRCPKDVFVTRVTLEVGVASAVITFNDGFSEILVVFDKLNIKPGTFSEKYCGVKNEKQITQMQTKLFHSAKQRHNKIRRAQGFQDKCEENEGISYEVGLF